MNRHIFTVLFFGLAVFVAHTQKTITRENKINWTGIETWTAPNTSKQVIAFADARYPADNDLPYFTQTITKENNVDFNVSILNPVFQSVSAEERSCLSDKPIPADISITTFITRHRGAEDFHVQLLPFVKRGEEVKKLISFTIQLEEKIKPQSVGAATRHAYTTESVLKSGNFVKVKISESGIYKLTYEALSAMGISPADVRVFGYGGALQEQDFTKFKPDDLPEVAIWIEKGSDNIFNAGDYILFYGQGVTKWKFDSSKKIFTHTRNPYATEGYYFITSDAGGGKKIQEKTISLPSDAVISAISEFNDYQVHEIERVNIGKTGKTFYGEEFSGTLSYNFPFTFQNLTSDNITARIDVAAVSTENTSFDFSLNGANTKNISIARLSDRYDVGKDANVTFTFPTPTTSDLTCNLTYNRTNNGSRGYLNYIAINVRRTLRMTGSVMFFRNVDNLNTLTYNKYQISDANANVQIWDITDQSNIARIATTRTGDILEFTDSNEELKQYVAIDPTAKTAFTLEPANVGNVANQNIHGLGATDMLIITHPNFTSQAEKLAEAHRIKDNLRVNVVTIEQVYNEFSSGTPDVSAYRWAMKMFYDRAVASGITNDLPKYLLLFGRGTYDNRGIINNSGYNLVLTYQHDFSLNLVESFVTDDYFGLMDDNEGENVKTGVIDIGIGRFPVVTTQHAEDVVSKIISYMNNEIKGNWKNQLGFVADDGNDSTHIRQAEELSKTLFKASPQFQHQKIYLDAFPQEVTASGESYPMADKKLHGLLNSGLFMLNYSGHASHAGWTGEKILTTNDVKTMFNRKLPFWFASTCDFVLFDKDEISAGEYVLLNPTGGGIGIMSAARTVYANQNERINRYFTIGLFEKNNGQYPRLGDAYRKAKSSIGPETNKLTYMLFGDPALKLNYPSEYTVVTEYVNSIPVLSADTLRALSVNEIQGYMADTNGNRVNNFNGTLEITVYDKIQQITTLNNPGIGDEKNSYYKFTDRPNILYAGKVRVINGDFTFSFMMPKDIRYNYGSGRINYYANDTISGKEGQGYFENFIVGGSNSNVEYENEGPDIEMYLNTASFRSGDKVNETPLFVARVADESGINTVGSGIGNDLRLVIDNNPYNYHTLNEYYEAEIGSYQAGWIRFKIPELTEGKHTLTFYARDLLNNSSQATMDFEVVHGLNPIIFNISNFPNPVKTQTTFVVEHNRPEVVLETKIDIYDLTGRMIFSKEQSNADSLMWDLRDSNGNKVRTGLYMYNVSVKTSNSEYTSKGNKIIVLEQ
ncbi:MAG: type IX secretion system sortase PorU [Paludibacteraceae bacterium]